MIQIQKFKNYFKVLLVIFSVFFITGPVLAAQINLISDIETINVGQKFWLDIMIDPAGEDINALEGVVNYPHDKLSLVNVNDGNSIINLWIKKPDIKNNQAVFSGIIPGGFSGVLSPFYSGAAAGKVISLQFLVTKGGEIKVDLDNLQVLLNNGLGTAINTDVQAFEIVPTENIITFSSREEVTDFEAPEAFSFQIVKDKSIFENKYILIFNTQDKGSGIDHYEVQEGQRGFVIAQSPYLLKNQHLDEQIVVKAIDRAGNERISRVGPPRHRTFLEKYGRYCLVLLIIIMLFLSYFLKKYIKNNKD